MMCRVFFTVYLLSHTRQRGVVQRGIAHRTRYVCVPWKKVAAELSASKDG